MSDPDLIPYCVIATISIALSIFVIVSLLRIGLKSCLSQLIFMLQLTLLLQEIFSYPQIYTRPAVLCQVSSALKQYFTISNLIVNFFLSYATYRILFLDSASYTINYAIHGAVILIPLPFLISYYAYAKENEFCSFSKMQAGVDWGVAFVLCGFVINACAFAANTFIIAKLLKAGSQSFSLIYRVMRGSTLYCLITVGFWIPKIFVVDYGQFTNVNVGLEASRFFTFFSGIAYFFIFLVERENMIKFENQIDSWKMSSHYRESIDSIGNRPSVDSNVNSINNSTLNLSTLSVMHGSGTALNTMQFGRYSNSTANISMNDSFSTARDSSLCV